jgi:hypothetical protein
MTEHWLGGKALSLLSGISMVCTGGTPLFSAMFDDVQKNEAAELLL